MATLFDALSAHLSGNDEDAQPIAGQQDQLQKSLQAKSGKATTTPAEPAASNVGEDTAIAAGQTQLAQGSLQSKIAGLGVQEAAQSQQASTDTAAAASTANTNIAKQNLATQAATGAATTASNEQQATQATDANEAMKVTTLNNEADKQARQLASDKQLSLDNIFREFKSSQEDLAFREDAADLEHVGRVLALRDKAYVDEINRIGAERDLSDRLNFQDESERIMLGDQLDKLGTDIGFKEKLNASQRDWDTYLAGLNANNAMMIAQAVIKDTSANEMYSGAGTAIKGGIDYAYKPSSSATKSEFVGGDSTDSVNSNGTLNSQGTTDMNQNSAIPSNEA